MKWLTDTYATVGFRAHGCGHLVAADRPVVIAQQAALPPTAAVMCLQCARAAGARPGA